MSDERLSAMLFDWEEHRTSLTTVGGDGQRGGTTAAELPSSELLTLDNIGLSLHGVSRRALPNLN